MSLDPLYNKVYQLLVPSELPNTGMVYVEDSSSYTKLYATPGTVGKIFSLAQETTAYGNTGGSIVLPDDTQVVFSPVFKTGDDALWVSGQTHEFYIKRVSSATPIVNINVLTLMDSTSTGTYQDSYGLYINNSTGAISFFSHGSEDFGGPGISTNLTIPLNTWVHVAIVHDRSTLKLYLDGVQAYSRTFTLGSTQFMKGSFMGSPTQPLGDYVHIGDIRYTYGIRYTSNFTAPTTPFPSVFGPANSILLGFKFEIARKLPNLISNCICRFEVFDSIQFPFYNLYPSSSLSTSSSILTNATMYTTKLFNYLSNAIASASAKTSRSVSVTYSLGSEDIPSAHFIRAFLFRVSLNTSTVKDLVEFTNVINSFIRALDNTAISYTEDLLESIDLLFSYDYLNNKVTQVLDRLKVGSTISTRLETIVSLISLLQVLDRAYVVFVEAIDEDLQYLETIENIYNTVSEVIDSLFLAYDTSNQLDLTILTSTDFNISEDLGGTRLLTNLLTSNFILRLKDKKEDSHEYKTYLLSPETSSVTTYSNYKFDSSTVYNRKYLFCNSSGLYLYGGKDDDGTPIRKTIKTPAYDFSTSNLKQIPSVYLGVTTDDILLVKVRVDSKSESIYKLNKRTKHLQTEKIDIGKGSIGRYFQFEIITDAETLELESIEFYPVMLRRKL